MPIARLSPHIARNLVRRHPLLATKFYVPQPQPEEVNRSELIDRLDRGAQRPLTILTAPAGFGKTSLLSVLGMGLNSIVQPVSILLGYAAACFGLAVWRFRYE